MKRLVVFSLAMILAAGNAQDTEPGMADIFFLDLGIVIEPATGKETFSREIGKTSKEVEFRIKKVKSGSVYMAASQEMMDALSRIQERMDRLEQSFQHELSSLSEENRLLRNTISNIGADLHEASIATPDPKESIVEQPAVKPVIKTAIEEKRTEPEKTQAPSLVSNASPPSLSFNMNDYMKGLFAYEREDYKAAIKIFASLSLDGASTHLIENVLYWRADAYQHLGNTEEALKALDEMLALSGSKRKDDALIKRGLLLRKQGQEQKALLSFGELIRSYPNSEYARLAQLELNKAEKLQ